MEDSRRPHEGLTSGHEEKLDDGREEGRDDGRRLPRHVEDVEDVEDDDDDEDDEADGGGLSHRGGSLIVVGSAFPKAERNIFSAAAGATKFRQSSREGGG